MHCSAPVQMLGWHAQKHETESQRFSDAIVAPSLGFLLEER